MDLIEYLLKDAFARFFRNGGFFLAAAVAFFASISVFPLLLLAFIILVTFVKAGVAEPIILAIANTLIPNGADFFQDLLKSPVGTGSLGIFGIIALVYAGMAVFGALQYALDRSFESKTPRTYRRWLLTSLVMALIAGGLIVVNAVFRIEVGLLIRSAMASTPALATFLTLLTEVLTFMASFAVITLTYTYVPTDRRGFADVWPGALFGSVSVFIAQLIFGFWLRYTTLRLIFGGLTAIIVLLIWLDVTALLIVLGAEIAASWMDRATGFYGRKHSAH